MAASVVALVSGLAGATHAVAQTTDSPPAAASVVEEVVVTGVRGKPRSIVNSPTPIDVIGGKELKDAGHANLYQDLQVQVPSFNQPSKAGSGTATAVLTGGLRGLNPDHTLVLVNGQRWHHTALINVGNQLYNGSVPVDMGMIPTSSIERIEVLREGAAAQYGSDAIAGVINVILKDTTGGSLSAQYGKNFDRGDGQLTLVRGDYGFKYSDTGTLNLFFSAHDQKISDRSISIAPTIQLFPKINGQPDPREATIDRHIHHSFGANPVRQIQFGYNLQDQIGDVEVYSFAAFNRRKTDIPYPLQFANNAFSLPQIYPAGFYPQFRIDEHDGQVAAGARGELSGWSWNLSTTLGENNAKESVSQTLNPSLGPTSPTSFYLGTIATREWANSLDVTRHLDLAGGGGLQVSFGFQHRLDQFKTEAGVPESYIRGTYVIPAGQPFAGTSFPAGAQSTPGFRPEDAGSWKRNILAAYGELGYEPNDRLYVGAAGRFEHSDDSAGSSLVGKLDGRYKLTDWLTIRGSVGNGFHAPSLVQQHYSNARSSLSTAAATLGQPIINAVLPVDNPVAKALGAQPLTPEKSVDMSAGVTLTPISNLTVTVDGYIVRVDDRIVLTGILQGAGVSNILSAAGLSSLVAAQYFTNAVDTKTVGADIIATWRKDLGDFGNLRLSAAINLNNTKIKKIKPNPAALASLGSSYVLFDRSSQGFLTDAIPDSKVAIGANWSLDRFDVGLQNIRYDKFTAPNNTPSLDRYFGAKWITNLSVQYHLTKQVTIAAGADNIFNVYPPANGIILTNYGYNQYPRFSPFGFTGGSYYTRIQVKF